MKNRQNNKKSKSTKKSEKKLKTWARKFRTAGYVAKTIIYLLVISLHLYKTKTLLTGMLHLVSGDLPVRIK